MEIIFWVGIFVAALAVLVKGADWLVESSEKIGLILGFSPFIIGVTIVAIGTSLPELSAGIFAVFQNEPEIVVANVVGSNIANILLIIGVSSLVAGRLVITRNLIDIDLPLFFITTTLFLGTVWDGLITWKEGALLVATFLIYLAYSITQRKDKEEVEVNSKKKKSHFQWKIVAFLSLGVTGLYFGSKYLIEATIELSSIFNIAPAVVAITAIAIGTSLPEFVVSVKAARQKKHAIAVGNVLGSNVFNVLVVVGLPAFLRDLPVDNQTMTLGLPLLLFATVFFVISGISRCIHKWEGALYLVVYAFFIGKLFGLI